MDVLKSAEAESKDALKQVLQCIEGGASFVLEAGAGAGKTHSLVKTLEHVLSRFGDTSRSTATSIACITYTNVARDEIRGRIDNNPLVFCDTIHGFAWSLIEQFQEYIRKNLQAHDKWIDRQDRQHPIERQPIRYSFGLPRITEDQVTLGHDDVIRLLADLLGQPKFRRILRSRYGYIFIDEYQDTDARLMKAIEAHLLTDPNSPVMGLFGDPWQQIYQGVCGHVSHQNLRHIGKRANFRSTPEVVDVLNSMRPALPQSPGRAEEHGSVRVYHTNDWKVERLSKGHWAGDLPQESARVALDKCKSELSDLGWFEKCDTNSRVLMLTHRVLASEQGYESIPAIYPYSDVFRKLDDAHLEYMVERLEPACEAFLAGEYAAMFDAMSITAPVLNSQREKAALVDRMRALIELRNTGTVQEVIDFLNRGSFPALSARVIREEGKLADALASDEGLSKRQESLSKLKQVSYKEIVAFSRWHRQDTPYATKHGVKGAEFNDVLVATGRGWNLYNFDQMLSQAGDPGAVPADKLVAYERNRNLFYVSCSRAKNRLALLFTQKLSEESLRTLVDWFGAENIFALAE